MPATPSDVRSTLTCPCARATGAPQAACIWTGLCMRLDERQLGCMPFLATDTTKAVPPCVARSTLVNHQPSQHCRHPGIPIHTNPLAAPRQPKVPQLAHVSAPVPTLRLEQHVLLLQVCQGGWGGGQCGWEACTACIAPMRPAMRIGRFTHTHTHNHPGACKPAASPLQPPNAGPSPPCTIEQE